MKTEHKGKYFLSSSSKDKVRPFCYNVSMTRLAVMSDLHIDLNHFETYEIDTLIKCLKDQKVTHLHIAGDISNHILSTRNLFYTNFLRRSRLPLI